MPRTGGPLPEDHDEHAEEGRERVASGRGTTKGDVLKSRFWGASAMDGGDKGREARPRPRGERLGVHTFGCLRKASLMSKQRGKIVVSVRETSPRNAPQSEPYLSS